MVLYWILASIFDILVHWLGLHSVQAKIKIVYNNCKIVLASRYCHHNDRNSAKAQIITNKFSEAVVSPVGKVTVYNLERQVRIETANRISSTGYR